MISHQVKSQSRLSPMFYLRIRAGAWKTRTSSKCKTKGKKSATNTINFPKKVNKKPKATGSPYTRATTTNLSKEFFKRGSHGSLPLSRTHSLTSSGHRTPSISSLTTWVNMVTNPWLTTLSTTSASHRKISSTWTSRNCASCSKFRCVRFYQWHLWLILRIDMLWSRR